MESVMECMRRRYSVRSYQNRPVEKEKILEILEAGRIAPTAANRQPFRIVVVQDPERVSQFRTLCKFREAPVVLIVCALPAEAWERTSDGFNAAITDTSIVCDHMMLAATDQGLGSLWMSSFDVKGVQREFSLPEGWEPTHLLCLGYANGEAASPTRLSTARKPLEELVRWM